MSLPSTLPPCRHCPHFAYRDHVDTATGLPIMSRPEPCPAQVGEGYDFAISEPGLCCDCGADSDADTVEYDGHE